MIDEAILGWAAGILDFQGHVVRKNNAQRARGSVQVAIYVTTSIHPIVERLSKLTGTDPEFKEQPPLKEEWMRRGCVDHCPEAHVHNTLASMPTVAKWTAAGAAASIVLWNLREFMVSTDEPWDWALATGLASTRLSGQGSGAAVKAIQRLSALGWDLPPLMRDVVPDQKLVFPPSAVVSPELKPVTKEG